VATAGAASCEITHNDDASKSGVPLVLVMGRVVIVLVVVVVGLGELAAEDADGILLNLALERLDGDDADRLLDRRRDLDERDLGVDVRSESNNDVPRALSKRDIGRKVRRAGRGGQSERGQVGRLVERLDGACARGVSPTGSARVAKAAFERRRPSIQARA
jgi:hypothetical protein